MILLRLRLGLRLLLSARGGLVGAVFLLGSEAPTFVAGLAPAIGILRAAVISRRRDGLGGAEGFGKGIGIGSRVGVLHENVPFAVSSLFTRAPAYRPGVADRIGEAGPSAGPCRGPYEKFRQSQVAAYAATSVTVGAWRAL